MERTEQTEATNEGRRWLLFYFEKSKKIIVKAALTLLNHLSKKHIIKPCRHSTISISITISTTIKVESVIDYLKGYRWDRLKYNIDKHIISTLFFFKLMYPPQEQK